MRKLPHLRFIIFYIAFLEAKRCFPSPWGPVSPLPAWHITTKGGGDISGGKKEDAEGSGVALLSTCVQSLVS